MLRFNTFEEARSAYASHAQLLAERGVINDHAIAYLPESFKRNFNLAMDAQPALSTDPNSGIPTMLTTMIDPKIYEILFAPNMAATIFGEVKKGTWVDQTAMFPTVEHTGETSSYGDYDENGHAGANTNWPQRQAYLFQTIKEYGELELDRAGLARLNWVSEIDAAAALALTKFSNLTYFFGVKGLENFGLLNDPGLSASITPAPKSYGGTAWIVNGVPMASATEVYTDIQSMYIDIVQRAAGLVDTKSKICLAMSPESQVALTITNAFGVDVYDLLKKNFPNIRFETAVQYAELSASNPQGVAGGNLVQMIIDSVEGQETGYCAFNEKSRAHPIVRGLSSFKQKMTAGTWGAIVRQPFGISSMLGV